MQALRDALLSAHQVDRTCVRSVPLPVSTTIRSFPFSFTENEWATRIARTVEAELVAAGATHVYEQGMSAEAPWLERVTNEARGISVLLRPQGAGDTVVAEVAFERVQA